MLVNMLSMLEQKPLLDTMAKEVVGINAPKIVFTRTNNERFDAAVSELGNTAGFIGAGVGMEKLLDGFFSWAQKHWGTAANAKTWEAVGRSGAIYSAVFAMMWAMPFIRNYMTAKRTGKVDFTDVIGEGKLHKPEDETKNSHQRLQAKLKEYLGMATRILGLGALGAALSMGGGALAMRSGLSIGKMGQWLVDRLALKGGAFSDFAGLKAVLFWGIPAYGGWMHASRDPYERKEQLLKFFNFVFCFIAPQQIIKSVFAKKFTAIPGIPQNFVPTFENIAKLSVETVKQAATRLKVTQELTGLVSSIVLLGVTPALMNFFLTDRRIEKSRNTATAMANAALVRGDFHRKSFEAFAGRAQSTSFYQA